jgi:hypothetical protein
MAATDDLALAQDALNDNRSFSYQGKIYTPKQIRDQLLGEDGILTKAAQKQIKEEQVTRKLTKQEQNLANRARRQTETAVSRAESELRSLENNTNLVRQDFKNNLISEQEYENHFNRITKVKTDISLMRSGAATGQTVGTSGYQVTPLATGMIDPATGTPTGMAPATATAMSSEGTRFVRIGTGQGVIPGAAQTGTTVTTTNVAGATGNVVGTGAGTAGATAGMTPRERRAATNWEARVQAEAGEYAYLLDPKFEGVADLLRKAVSQNWFKSDEGKAQFVQELQATAYGRNTSKKQQAFDTKSPGEKTALVQAEVDKIRAEYGEIQLDQTALEEVATAAARNGASDIERGRLVYRAAFKRGAAAPDYTAPVAARTALGGEDADRIRTIYRAYGVKADDQQIARILAQETDPVTGTVMTEDMLRNNLRDLAKVSYQPFADLLDRGLSVETIFSPYQQIAARVLEKAPDEVSLTNANGVPTEFATALMGEKPMSLTDWITRLKSDERYGWQFTSEAKQKATNLVMDLEKAFGFRA